MHASLYYEYGMMLCINNKVRSQASDISRTPLGGGDSTDQTSQANLRKLNFTKFLYQLAYSQVLLQHLNKLYLKIFWLDCYFLRMPLFVSRTNVFHGWWEIITWSYYVILRATKGCYRCWCLLVLVLLSLQTESLVPIHPLHRSHVLREKYKYKYTHIQIQIQRHIQIQIQRQMQSWIQRKPKYKKQMRRHIQIQRQIKRQIKRHQSLIICKQKSKLRSRLGLGLEVKV